MNNLIFNVKMNLDKQEIDVLTKALDFYILGGVVFDYPDEVEICKDVQRKIKRNLFVKYLSKETIN